MSVRINGKLTGRTRRKLRVRKRVNGTAERPRLSVFRSAKHLFVQVVDDVSGRTLVSVGTHGKTGLNVAEGHKVDLARAVGKKLAELCQGQQIGAVVFDRNGFRYTGRVRAVAEGAREGGLSF